MGFIDLLWFCKKTEKKETNKKNINNILKKGYMHVELPNGEKIVTDKEKEIRKKLRK